MSGPGIDYGRGTANRDPDTGIRYGVISQHSVSQAWADEAEGDYGERALRFAAYSPNSHAFDADNYKALLERFMFDTRRIASAPKED